MRISRRRLKRYLRRTAQWVWPREARDVLRARGWATLAILSVLLLHAESSVACLSVAPDRSPLVQQHTWMDSLAADRSADAVHASARSFHRQRAVLQPARLSRSRSRWSATGEMQSAPLGPPPAVSPAQPPPRTVAHAVRFMPEGGSRAILQGEFAILLAQALHLRAPRSGWSTHGAINVLVSLRLRGKEDGITPSGGWRNARPLTEGDVASLLQQLGLRVIARNPERSISVDEAQRVVARLAAFFRQIAPAPFSAAAFPTPIRLGNPARRPASPATP